ncbi:MAG TPA: pyridoxal phosphate-dependent aminotransferase family protein [Aliidongia sp.]|uniref:aminotransferase class I/II-fold pyridoxal phosphate-dependent enzyme n=1 Tax=Aliidongia sp. TaxID=1914230 RepID=UPI002DDDB012|nr:pyridoxal phosphate-dependent aminotransferase family protein [Aliidongia sp.]HEV2678306.1 pyridoxal phosphate-dependent aminotransferase family protein [Aliidongia sp.]
MIVLTGRQGARTESGERRLLMFGSNDYLGLAGDPAVVHGGIAALERYGTGLAMNQPFATTPLHEALRERIADFTGTEAALLFGSCTTANIALLTTLAGTLDAVVLSDADNHASIIDGCRLARGRTIVYRTRDLVDLRDQVAATRASPNRTVVSDGVFSVEGDVADGAELARIARQAGASLVLDDSHAAGVIGARGRGTAEACGLDARTDVAAVTGTFAKAFGAGGGGYVAGSATFMAEVKRAARFYIFSTGMHVAAVGAALIGVDRATTDIERLERLRANVLRLRTRLIASGFTLLGGGASPITPILIGDEEQARRLSLCLAQRGLVAPVMTFPIVPQGAARLRLQPSACHDEADIDLACEILAEEATAVGLFA